MRLHFLDCLTPWTVTVAPRLICAPRFAHRDKPQRRTYHVYPPLQGASSTLHQVQGANVVGSQPIGLGFNTSKPYQRNISSHWSGRPPPAPPYYSVPQTCAKTCNIHKMYKIYKNVQNIQKYTKIYNWGAEAHRAIGPCTKYTKMYKSVQKCTKV